MAHKYRLWPYLENVTEYNFPELFKTAIPSNPYRNPSFNKLYFVPATLEEWTDLKKTWRNEYAKQSLLLNIAEGIWQEHVKNKSVVLRGLTQIFLHGMFVRPHAYTYRAFQVTAAEQQKAIQDIINPEKLEISRRILSNQESNDIRNFIFYQRRQVDIIRNFLITFGNKSFSEIQHEPGLLSYLLPLPFVGIARNLINSDVFQTRNYQDTEVIIFDSKGSYQSRHLNYAASNASLDEENESESTHPMQVAGVIAAKEDLSQLKGIAPGTRILVISEINKQTLAQINKSTANVINVSRMFQFPPSCAKYFKMWNQNPESFGNTPSNQNIYCQAL